MGSGKSSTMRFIASHLQAAGHDAAAIHERTEPHPVRATDELEHWFEPWRDTTAAKLAERALARWAAFVDKARLGTTVSVLDGQLFHGDLTNLLLMEGEPALIEAYVQELARTIAPLSPLVIYFWQRDIDAAVRTVCAERGDDWVTYQTDWKLAAPYCMRRGLTGLDGLIALYRDYRRTTDALFAQLPLDKLSIENGDRDWATVERRILDALKL
ncbi:hypothetical protein C5615_26745 [Burkholderia cepacia]|uniref:Uncharacterized protein n=3 Tax=Burkholderia cepacia complex TaxID=87882 RepID=A0A2S8IHY2_BURCE|nr:hypothetical protein C5615_26745 [Burkholderia cepacia]HDR9509734.1 hypothetical protein [Burkholderia cepacia]HDR9512440.1 hypothetical protein [Burkholderia cepacia]